MNIFPDDTNDDVVPNVHPCPIQVVVPKPGQKIYDAGKRVFYLRMRINVSADVYFEVPDDDAKNYEKSDELHKSSLYVLCIFLVRHNFSIRFIHPVNMLPDRDRRFERSEVAS